MAIAMRHITLLVVRGGSVCFLLIKAGVQNCFTCLMDHYNGNDDTDNYSHWIVQDTEDQGYEPIAESSVIRRQRISSGKKHEELP